MCAFGWTQTVIIDLNILEKDYFFLITAVLSEEVLAEAYLSINTSVLSRVPGGFV